MSRRLCCVWGCTNKKGKCPEDIAGNRLCGCPLARNHGCPKPQYLTLHSIHSMPDHVKQVVIEKINLTRQGGWQTKWQPSKEAVICNIHYADCKGPTRDESDVLPINFKRPRNYPVTSSAPKKRRTLERKSPPEKTTRRRRRASQAKQHSEQPYSSQEYQPGDEFNNLQAGQLTQHNAQTNHSGQLTQINTETHNSGQLTQLIADSNLHTQQVSEESDDTQSGQLTLQCTNTTENTQQLSESTQSGKLTLQCINTTEDAQQLSEESDSTQSGQLTLRCNDTTVDLEQHSEEFDNSPTDQHSQQQCERNDFQLSQTASHTEHRGPDLPVLQVANHELRVDYNVENLMKENEELRLENMKLKEHIQYLNTHIQRLDVTLLSDGQVNMYTGISRKLFDCIDRWLQPMLRKQTTSEMLSPTQKLLLVLMRLRQNHSQSDLACRFNVDQSSISRILNHWIPLLSAQFKRLIQWPQTCIGPSVAPYDLLPNSVAIIDGTEIFIQRPSNLATQKSSYSDYKSHTTVKYLVAVDTFTGVFVYVSAGFSGNSSDRFTIEHSGILENLKPGQRILADKGYNARDLFAQKRCFLTIPSFLNEGTLAAQEARQSRSIASVRIRVENAIRRIKEYKIFTETLCNRTNRKIVDDMVVVVCALCNLKEKLIK